MAQALDNVFQRSRTSIQDTVLRSLATQKTSPDVTVGQTCLEWLNTPPEAVSNAFADQLRRHVARPETFPRHRRDRQSALQLVDDDTFRRQLAEEKAGAYLAETLFAEMLRLFGRMEAVHRAALADSPSSPSANPGHGNETRARCCGNCNTSSAMPARALSIALCWMPGPACST